MAISNLGKTLIMHGFDAKTILLKMWLSPIISSTMLEVIGVNMFS